MTKRFLSIFFAFLFLLIPMSIARADGTVYSLPEGTPSSNPYYTDEFTVIYPDNERGNYISDYTLTITSNSVGHVSIAASVTTTATMQKLGFTTIRVQHWNGSSWEDVWTKTDQFSTNTNYFAYVKTLGNMTSDDYYRVSVDFYAKKGFLQTQTLTIVSNYIRCR